MGFLQLLGEFFPTFFGVLSEHGYGALVFTGGEQLKVDIMLFQQAMEIGQLGQHADGPDHGKWCRDNAVGHAGHHVTAAGGHLVDGDRQRHAGIPYPL